MSLGRIFNVVGAIIDRYLGLSLSSQFNILIPMDLGMFIESHEQYAYTLCYLNAVTDDQQIFRQPLILLELSLFHELFWYATTTLIAHIDWLFYCCSLYMQYTAHKSMSIWHKQASLSLGSIYHQCAPNT